VLSDVVGDPLRSIASGPTVGDAKATAAAAAAAAVVTKYDLAAALPPSVRAILTDTDATAAADSAIATDAATAADAVIANDAAATINATTSSDVATTAATTTASTAATMTATAGAAAETATQRRCRRKLALVPSVAAQRPRPATRVIGSSQLAVAAAEAKARELGYNTMVLSTRVEGEAREVAKYAVRGLMWRHFFAAHP
jgi:glycerate-2-kinase